MRIGIDLGGTKIEAIALADSGTNAGAILLRHRVPTPSGDYTAILDSIANLVEFAEREIGERGTVGVATPGAISPATGLLKNSNSTVLNGKPLDRDLEHRLQRPIRMENDANCLALSEAVDGAAAGAPVVFAVILGTGVGGGISIHRTVHVGRNRIAGEWGHNPLPWMHEDELPGRLCYCGKHGCIETFLSGAGLTHEYQKQGGDLKTAIEIGNAATLGHGIALTSLAIYQDRLARALASVINVLDPDVIVLAGGLSNLTALYSGLQELVKSYAFSADVGTPVVRAKHGDSSGVRGAAWLWPL